MSESSRAAKPSAGYGGSGPQEPDAIEPGGMVQNECAPAIGPNIDDRTLARQLHDLDVANDWYRNT